MVSPIPDLPNVSLIAFYGNKPQQLTTLIQNLQNYLSNHQLIQDRFIPYQLTQVHGTIIGCEGLATESGVINKWFRDYRQQTRYIDFSGFLDYLQHQVDLPLTIRFGGYHRHGNYHFLSRQQSLYLRSFQLQTAASQTLPVLIGWSWCDHQVKLSIDNLRRNFQQFNLLHKYHRDPKASDNDFYLRLGTIEGELDGETIETIADEVRCLLENQPPSYISLQPENLTFAQYQDLSLNPLTTKVVSFNKITARELEQMY